MTDAVSERGLEALLSTIARERGFDCAAYKQGCLRRRVAVRMRARAVHTYDEYLSVLSDDPEEFDRLLDALTINVSKFFRNRGVWDRVAERVLPDLWGARRGRLRCWSAGCAAGEEPYTIAILLLECARREGVTRPDVAVDGTDLDSGCLERAARGCYRAEAFDEMPAELRAQYVSGQPPFCIRPEVQDLVRWRRHDLLREPPPDPPYDLVVCRNVIIYFDRATQERLFTTLTDALSPGGRLVLGRVETLSGEARARFELEDARERIYRRR